MSTLNIVGIFLIIVGGAMILMYIFYRKKVEISHDERRNILIYQDPINILIGFTVPSSSECHVRYKPERKLEVAFEIYKKVEGGQPTLYDTKYTRKGDIKFKLEEGVYDLKIRSRNEGISQEGINEIFKLIDRYNFEEIDREMINGKLQYQIVTRRTNGGKYFMNLDSFIKRDIHIFLTNLDEEGILRSLLNEFNDPKFKRILVKWHEEAPNIFKEISDIVKKHTKSISSGRADIDVKLIRVEKLPDWVYQIGGIMATIGVGVIFSTLK